MTVTFVSMSYNIWGDHRLADRLPALRALLELRDPDLLSVQELRPESRDLVDEVLSGHERVDDPAPGWAREGNIWWRREVFELFEYGAEDVGHRERHRRLFWVRLRPRGAPDAPPLLYSTAHLTWQGNARERADDVNPRVAQARRVGAELQRLAGDGPCVFTVDINDVARPVWAMREAGFADSFNGLGVPSPVTHPAVPLFDADGLARASVPKVLDWQFYRGEGLRPRCSEVVEFCYSGRAPSDHKPVVVTYAMPAG